MTVLRPRTTADGPSSRLIAARRAQVGRVDSPRAVARCPGNGATVSPRRSCSRRQPRSRRSSRSASRCAWLLQAPLSFVVGRFRHACGPDQLFSLRASSCATPAGAGTSNRALATVATASGPTRAGSFMVVSLPRQTAPGAEPSHGEQAPRCPGSRLWAAQDHTPRPQALVGDASAAGRDSHEGRGGGARALVYACDRGCLPARHTWHAGRRCCTGRSASARWSLEDPLEQRAPSTRGDSRRQRQPLVRKRVGGGT
jgi:hypothetical protein